MYLEAVAELPPEERSLLLTRKAPWYVGAKLACMKCGSTRLSWSLSPQRENERRDRPPFEEKNQDVQPPNFDVTQRSKEGAKNDALQPSGVVLGTDLGPA